MSHSRSLRIATAQYDVARLDTWDAYRRKIGRWVDEAAAEGAELLLFPEYFSMELASLFGDDIAGDLRGQIEAMQDCLPDFLALFGALALDRGVHIVAGSYPVRVDGGFRNRVHVFAPTGESSYQDKLQMTRFENEAWDIAPGDTLTIHDTALGPLGISICYEAEFPLLARAQMEAGARLLLVPSCTDTLAGFNRVRIGARARALENQCYAVHASTVGDAAWSRAIDVNVGAAGVYTPIDSGFPDDGVLVTGPLNESRWVFADLDMDALEAVRNCGQVLNYRDWDNQHGPLARPVTIAHLDRAAARRQTFG